MKTVFDTTTRNELIQRINTLTESNTAQWGKMNVYQMIKHCRLWEETALGKTKYKRVFIGRIFGKIGLRRVLKDDQPLTHNSPPIPDLIITETGDVSNERKKWVALIEEYAHISSLELIHPFFGKMTMEQTGRMAYKHTDHHLRQFNA